jgi:CRISPR-associated protein Cas2
MLVTLRMIAVPDHLHGYLSRFLIECSTGFYVGNISPRVVEGLWKRATDAALDGEVIMVTSSPATEQGFQVRLHQISGRELIDQDGLILIKTTHTAQPSKSSYSLQ